MKEKRKRNACNVDVVVIMRFHLFWSWYHGWEGFIYE